MPHRRTLEGLSRPGLRLQGWRRLPAGSKIAVVILALIAAMAILAPVVAPYDPGDTGLAKIERTVHVEGIGDTVISDTAVPPSAQHPFGTDKPSRDIFSRAVYGARVSLVVGLSATGIALALAGVLGAVAATGRKWVGELVSRRTPSRNSKRGNGCRECRRRWRHVCHRHPSVRPCLDRLP